MFGWGRRERERRARVEAAAWALIARHGASGAFVELERRRGEPLADDEDLDVHAVWAEVKRQAGMGGADVATRMLYQAKR